MGRYNYKKRNNRFYQAPHCSLFTIDLSSLSSQILPLRFLKTRIQNGKVGLLRFKNWHGRTWFAIHQAGYERREES